MHVQFSQLASSAGLIEDETVNDSNIISNLTYCEDGQKEQDTLSADKIYSDIQIFNKPEKTFSKIDSNSETSLKFQKEPLSCLSAYCDFYKQLMNRPSL
ncbi:uncharacterized protein TNCV_3576301 [Trichonephila clavipes]|nr:uncharacterized protein TNCV_3576301 [Trichonephila clavipes]